MTDTTEELKRDMYYDIACLKGQKKHPILLARFESKLEEYLEAMRQDHAKLVESLQIQVTLYQDAYENQKALTRNACVYDRERWDELYQLRSDLKSAEHDREDGHDKLQEAASKLASQAQTIEALHRVIKAQQNACARFKELVRITEGDRIREQAQAHRQITQLEADVKEYWAQVESKQELIVSQRKRIEELKISVMNASAHAPNHWFLRFFPRRTSIPKPLPKKTI